MEVAPQRLPYPAGQNYVPHTRVWITSDWGQAFTSLIGHLDFGDRLGDIDRRVGGRAVDGGADASSEQGDGSNSDSGTLPRPVKGLLTARRESGTAPP